MKYQLSRPVIYDYEGYEYAYVIVKRTMRDGNKYVKYNFIKDKDRWYYKDFETISKVKE